MRLEIIMAKTKNKKLYKTIWTTFTAFLFIGIGLGLYFEQVAAGTLVGMGVGFLVAVALSLKYRKEL